MPGSADGGDCANWRCGCILIPVESTASGTGKPFNGKVTILLVDDDELMREVTAMMIEESGGLVLTAVNGFEAVDMYKKHRDVIDAVCLDFSMPGKNGFETYKDIRAIDPDARAVMISGLRIPPEVEAATRESGILFVPKPFEERVLIAALDKVRKKR